MQSLVVSSIEVRLQLFYIQHCYALILLRNPTEAIATVLKHVIMMTSLKIDLANICAELECGNIIFSFNLENFGVFNLFVLRDPCDMS